MAIFKGTFDELLEKEGFRKSVCTMLLAAKSPTCRLDLAPKGKVFGKFGVSELAADSIIDILVVQGLLIRSYNSLSMPLYVATEDGSALASFLKRMVQ